ncbi:uncharacterized protein [Macrobrachium rosenbergii]|uniref:uncharacterized protein n=1 Tax=Macrobrachium rosenbergii TaxID=79674 RepID=UPI0034D39964
MGNNSSSELSADEVATQVRHHYYYGAGAPNTFIRKVKTGHDHEAGAEEEVAGDATTPADSPQQCNPPPTPPPPTTEGNEQPGEDCHVIKEDVQASSRHDESSSPHSDPDPFAEDFPLDEDLMGSNNNEASRIGGGSALARERTEGNKVVSTIHYAAAVGSHIDVAMKLSSSIARLREDVLSNFLERV